jgi:hypothetical protein
MRLFSGNSRLILTLIVAIAGLISINGSALAASHARHHRHHRVHHLMHHHR